MQTKTKGCIFESYTIDDLGGGRRRIFIVKTVLLFIKFIK